MEPDCKQFQMVLARPLLCGVQTVLTFFGGGGVCCVCVCVCVGGGGRGGGGESNQNCIITSYIHIPDIQISPGLYNYFL